MLTLWVIGVTFFSIYFIGLPFTLWLDSPQRESQDRLRAHFRTAIILAPLVGIAIIVLFSQNLIYLGLPIKATFYWLYIIAFVMWGWLLYQKKISGLTKQIPIKLLLVIVCVYLINALGLLALGAKYYVARGWMDQLNYTFAAQYLMSFHFSQQAFPAIEHIPYALKALTLFHLRIGVYILQAFMSASSFFDAKTTFEATILLLPPLVVMVIYHLAEEFKLKQNIALFIAAVAGVLPGIAYVHLEAFFAQAICIPFLLLWPYVLFKVQNHLHWKNVLFAALLLSAAISIYTEFYLLFVGVGLVSLLGIFYHHKDRFGRVILSLFSIYVLAFLLNIGYFNAFINTMKGISASNVLGIIYPWANHFSGLERIWLGDWVAAFPGWLYWLVAIFSVVLLLEGILGLLVAGWKRKDTLTLGVLALSLLPAVFLPVVGHYKYQFYKILLSISPLYILGIGLWYSQWPTDSKLKADIKVVAKYVVIAFALLSATSTASMALRTGVGKTMAEIGRGGAFKVVSLPARKVQDKLESLKNEELIINWHDDFFNGNYVNGWLAYYSRNNHVTVINPHLGDGDISVLLPKFVASSRAFYLLIPATTKKKIAKRVILSSWQAGPYLLLRVKNSDAISTYLRDARMKQK